MYNRDFTITCTATSRGERIGCRMSWGHTEGVGRWHRGHTRCFGKSCYVQTARSSQIDQLDGAFICWFPRRNSAWAGLVSSICWDQGFWAERMDMMLPNLIQQFALVLAEIGKWAPDEHSPLVRGEWLWRLWLCDSRAWAVLPVGILCQVLCLSANPISRTNLILPWVSILPRRYRVLVGLWSFDRNSDVEAWTRCTVEE